MKPKLIIFDFSGTLAYFKKSDPKEFFSGLANLGLEIKNEEQMKLFDDLFKRNLVYTRDWQDFSEKMLNSFSIKAKKGTIEKMAEFFQENSGPEIYQDAKEIIDLPFPKAILSTGARFLIETVFPKGFEIFSPEETKFVKPDKRAFLCVLEKMKKKPEETIMIGDEIERDLVPAKDLGIETILIDREDKITDTAFKKIKSLEELKKILI
jgi:FMN phosphatase YigB (HAD superfamily)